MAHDKLDGQVFTEFSDAFTHLLATKSLPSSPILKRSDVVLTLGSCFARNIFHALEARGIRCGHAPITEYINSPLANRLFLEYAFEKRPFANDAHAALFTDEYTAAMRQSLPLCTALVFTVGVALCPFHNDQLVLGLTKKDLKSGIHWRMTTTSENVAHLSSIISIVRKVVPHIKIILTVSPVPLAATMLEEPVLISDCTSKSILRAAVSEIMTLALPDVYYWPSFEAVRWIGSHMPFQMYGTDDGNPRHVGRHYIQTIVDSFIQKYFEPINA